MNNTKLHNRSSMHEVGIVYKRPLLDDMPLVNSSEDAYNVLRTVIDDETIDHKEYFWLLLMNNANRALGFAEIGKGDVRGVVVNTKEIFQLAINVNAAGIIVSHNHPSGTLKPSQRDKDITKKVQVIGELFSVNLLDHIIITSEGYYSFSDEGLLY